MAEANIVSDVEVEITRAIQVVSLDNHSFRLHIDQLKNVLESDEIKDRHVVVVSIIIYYMCWTHRAFSIIKALRKNVLQFLV